MRALTIGQVAKQAEVGVETIRFYERQGLVERPDRRDGGFRRYEPAVVSRVRFIRRAKDPGFTLREIQDLLELRLALGSNCDDVRGRAEAKIADIEERIGSLTRMREALAGLVTACKASGSAGECPLLEALEDGRSSGTRTREVME